MRWKGALVIMILMGGALAQTEAPGGRQLFIDVRPNKHLSPIDPIKPLDFQVKLNGQLVRVLAADRKQVQPRVAVVLDTSGSMTYNPQVWDLAFQLTDQTIRALDGIAQISLTLSGDKFTKVFSRWDGTIVMLQKLQEFHDGKDPRIGHGRTQLWDAMSTAVNLGYLRAGDAVVVISDGAENSSHTTQSEIRDQLRSSGIRLYGFIFVLPRSSTPEERLEKDAFKKFAESSGGYFAPIEKGSTQEINDAISTVTDSITKPCVLRLDLPDSASGKLSVAYRGESGKFNRGLTVFAPKLLFAVRSVQDAVVAK